MTHDLVVFLVGWWAGTRVHGLLALYGSLEGAEIYEEDGGWRNVAIAAVAILIPVLFEYTFIRINVLGKDDLW